MRKDLQPIRFPLPKLRHKWVAKLTLLSIASKMFAAVDKKKADDEL